MTTVRGKAPLEARFVRETIGDVWTQKIQVRIEGPTGDRFFKINLTLEMHQARNLVRDLRREMRKVRDETVARMNRHVEEAEGPL
jgi:hypothetical protein